MTSSGDICAGTPFISKLNDVFCLQVKLAILKYLHGLIMMMDPSDFVNSAETRLAVSRIITWTMEPKSVDNRKGIKD